MLSKLFKHEFQATARSFLPLYAFSLIVSPIVGLLQQLGENSGNSALFIMEGLSLFGFIFLIFALFIASYVLIVMRFYRTTATSEAYLTFTLPVSSHQILLSKLITAVIWQILSMVVLIACILTMTFCAGMWSFHDVAALFHDLEQYLSGQTALYSPDIIFAWFPIMLIISSISATLQFYCAIMLGQLFRDHRIIASIGCYMALYIAMQTITSIISIPLLMNFENNTINTVNYVRMTLILSIILSTIFSAVLYFLSSFIMKKKLNVQ